MFADVATACTEETFTMAPPEPALNNGYANLALRKTERKLDAITSSHSSTFVSTKGFAI